MSRAQTRIRSHLTESEVRAFEATKAFFGDQQSGSVIFGYLETIYYLLEYRKNGGTVKEVFDDETGTLHLVAMFPTAATRNGYLDLDRRLGSDEDPEKLREACMVTIDCPFVLTQQALAERLGKTPRTIQRWGRMGLQSIDMEPYRFYRWSDVETFFDANSIRI